MIIKCVRGDYFPRLIDYIMRWGQYAASGEVPRVLAADGIFHPKTAAAQLWQQASLAPDRTRRAVHLIARAERGLTDEQYVDLASRMLRAADLEGRPFLFVLHDDDGHAHLATVEVNEEGLPPPRRLWSASLHRHVTAEEARELPDGDVTSRSWDSHLAWRLTQVSREVEVDFDLRRLGKGRDTFDKVRIPDWQLKREAEEGLVPLAKLLAEEMKAALDLPTWDERSEALALHGLALRPYDGPNKKRQGLQIYALADPAHFCNGSELGKSYGLGALEKRSSEPFREWLAGRGSDAADIWGEQVDRPPASPMKKKVGDRDPALLRLKAEYDGRLEEHRKARDERLGMARRHKDEARRDRRIIALLRERLITTGRVRKSWIRAITQIVRAELNAKRLVRHLLEKAKLISVGERQPKWPEFLAEKARADEDARRVHNQIRSGLSLEERLQEVERATDRKEERDRERRRLEQEAEEARSIAEKKVQRLAEAVRNDEEKTAAAERRQRLRDLAPELELKVRLRSVDDRQRVIEFLKDRPEDLDAFLHSSVDTHVAMMMASVVGQQRDMLRRALGFIESIEDPHLLAHGRVDRLKLEDRELRRVLIVTEAWPEVVEAVRERSDLLRARTSAAREAAASYEHARMIGTVPATVSAAPEPLTQAPDVEAPTVSDEIAAAAAICDPVELTANACVDPVPPETTSAAQPPHGPATVPDEGLATREPSPGPVSSEAEACARTEKREREGVGADRHIVQGEAQKREPKSSERDVDAEAAQPARLSPEFLRLAGDRLSKRSPGKVSQANERARHEVRQIATGSGRRKPTWEQSPGPKARGFPDAPDCQEEVKAQVLEAEQPRINTNGTAAHAPAEHGPDIVESAKAVSAAGGNDAFGTVDAVTKTKEPEGVDRSDQKRAHRREESQLPADPADSVDASSEVDEGVDPATFAAFQARTSRER